MTNAGSGTIAHLEGLTEVVNLGLSRAPVRTRESGSTLSAWRLGVASAQGPGTIDRVEVRGAGDVFRGQGVFLGWPQDGLARVYRRLLPASVPQEPDPGQLG